MRGVRSAIIVPVALIAGCGSDTQVGTSQVGNSTGGASSATGGTSNGGATNGGMTTTGGITSTGGGGAAVTGGAAGSGGATAGGSSGQSATGGRAVTDGGTGTGGALDAGSADSGLCNGAVFDGPCSSEGAFCGSCPNACAFCNVLRCSSGKWSRIEGPPAPCFDCGTGERCQTNVDYCDIAYSDVAGVPNDYACIPLPSSCRQPPQVAACSCLPPQLAGDRCTADRPGEIVVEHFGG